MNYTKWLEEVKDNLRNNYGCSESEIDYKFDQLSRDGFYLNELYHRGWDIVETAEFIYEE